MSKITVRRKGQMTLPAEVRKKLDIREGSVLELEETREGVLLRKIPPLEPGEPVGNDEHTKILQELEKLREAWA